MSEKTKIEWAEATFNPWIGCTKVSAGCKNCYAENTTRARVLRSQGHETWGKGAKRSRTSVANWKKPLDWDSAAQACGTRPKVFPSLCDWLDDEVPIAWLADFLKLIHDTPNLNWLLLTKRPDNWLSRLDEVGKLKGFDFVNRWLDKSSTEIPENIWIGTSVEDQEMADKRIPALLKIPATLRFLSVEPMLEPIDFAYHLSFIDRSKCGLEDDPLAATLMQNAIDEGRGDAPRMIEWVIFGGESTQGKPARPCNVEWIRNGVEQCTAAGVAAYVKQLGSNPIRVNLDATRKLGAAFYEAIKLNDKKGGDMAEWPEDLRIRELPEADYA